MPRPLVVSCDLSRLHVERPVGPAVYAAFVLDLLAGAGDVEVTDRRGVASADVILSLDGRFRAGRGQRTVTSVLDLGHLLERSGYGVREWLAQHWRVASAVHRSDHLLAPSEAVAFGLQRYLRVPAERITVLAPQPRPVFRRPPRERVEALRAALDLPPRYFLFVGSRARRKNLPLLAEAWRLAGARLGPGAGLVLAGPGGDGAVPGARDLGYVPLEHLPALLAGAIAWCNPSLYEGSAIGALEAMACGTPPLVAGTGAQARAVGTAGLVLDPHDPAAWADALAAIASDDGLRTRLAAYALKAAAEVRETRPRWPESLRPALLAAPAAAT
ncbi:MAG TPA: glycosyltransferase [Candidatus Dormibacteraeota bacterium]|nr:glycosyltransferase [Candidatus Dormibacteraeota bacterium]